MVVKAAFRSPIRGPLPQAPPGFSTLGEPGYPQPRSVGSESLAGHDIAGASLHHSARISDPSAVGTKSERRAARELVAGYHEAQLAILLEYVAAAIDAHRAGTLDVHDVDEVVHHYERAARELWKFCWSGGVGAHIEIVARLIDQPIDDEDVDWWQRGAPRERG